VKYVLISTESVKSVFCFYSLASRIRHVSQFAAESMNPRKTNALASLHVMAI
jgi:hypothetical protein